MMFSQVLFDALHTHHSKTLLSDKSRDLIGDDLLRLSNVFAQRLLDCGIKPGDRVGISLRDQIDALIVYLAAFRVGAVPAFIDFRIKPEQKSKLIDTFELVAMLDERKSTEYHPHAIPYKNDWFHDVVDNNIFIQQPKSSSGMLAISSGTTGLPKAYVLGDQTISARMVNSKSYNASEHPRILVAMPFAFAGTHNQVFPALLAGVEIHVMPVMYSTQQLISVLTKKNISGTVLPPAIVHNLLDEMGDSADLRFPNLKLLKCGGGVLDIKKAQRAHHVLSSGFQMAYGASVVGVVALLQGEDLYTNSAAAGRIISGLVIEAIDPKTGQLLPTGETGLLRFTSADIADAIISADPTDEKIENGRGISGDVGYVTEDGFVFITGRLSDTIVRAGVAVSPSAVENVLSTHPDIRDVAVCGVLDDRLGHDIAALIVAPKLNEAEVRQFIMEKVDQDKRPRQIRMVKALPYTRNGKLDRSSLPAKFT